jgi:NAD(P)-dependent dehydrogenase (short-subunit alcohol dehydrogenase family)
MTNQHQTSGPASKPPAARSKRVLVTGAAGKIGSYFAAHSGRGYQLRLTDRDFGAERNALGALGEIMEGSLADLDFLKKACEGIDTVVHLAGNPDASAVWRDLLETNVVGTYHAFVAARAAGVKRVVFASSIHAVSGYPPDVQVKTNEPVNPGDLYGVSKCFGEALGRYMAEQEGLSVIALRIGAFQPLAVAREKESLHLIDSFVSDRDLDQLIRRSIDVVDVRFAIVHCLSGNRFERLDISGARELLGYEPQDDFTNEYPGLKDLHLGDRRHSDSLSGHGSKSGLRDDL